MNKLPSWFRQEIPKQKKYFEFKKILNKFNITTVCKEAKCPNAGECYLLGKMTFMILGDTCTRSCKFCSVKKGIPKKINLSEINKICKIVSKLNLKYVVVTSVTRDDIPDGGAFVFAQLIDKLKALSENIKVEVLTPDFKGNEESIKKIINSKPDVFNHNLETVPSLYKKIRPEADFNRSLDVLKNAKNYNCKILTKSGIMLGLGEKRKEILFVFEKLKEADCDILTLGQYLKPIKNSIDVVKYYKPEEFEKYKNIALDFGFKYVFSGPLVRSSYYVVKS